MTKLEMMQLSQSLSDLYTGLETDLIANIAEYLAAGKIDSPTAQWKIQMLAQLGALDKSNIKVITEYAGIAPDMLTEVLETVALSAVEELEPGFQKLARNGIINGTEVPIEKTMARALTSYQKQAKQSLNMVNTVMRYKAKSAAQKIINDTAELAEKQSFINTLNKATGKVVTGAESRQAAMRQCIKEMSEKGIPAFVDKLGREWSPEAYINMDIRTTANNVAHQAQFDRMKDYGVDLIEVSSHAGARPKCAEDQGKIFNRKNKDGYTIDLHGRKIKYYSWKKSSYGEPDGILGINCGHHIYPFIPGISYQKYFPYDEYDNQEQYKKVQGQRELERRVRKSKRECISLESVGDTEGLKKAKETLKTRQQALKQYCTDNDLKYKPDRTAVVDYKKSVAGFTPSDKKKRIAEIKAKSVDKSGGSGTVLKVKNPVLTPGIVSDRKFYKSDNLVINPKLKNDVKNGFVDAANQVYGRFGRKLDIEKIDVVKSGSTRYMQAAYDPLTKTIKLVNSSMGTYEKKAEKLFADNWNASKDKYGTFYHEIGHAIWEDLSSEAKAQISAIYEAEKHSAYLKWIEAGGSSSGKSQVDFFGKALSRYGATNKNEFFSEAFSQIMSGRMRPVSRQVNQILQEKYASVQLNKNVLDKFEQGGIIKTDEVIGRSVGASAKNYPVKLPDGNHAKFAEGSTITKIKVFAGNGTNVPIRDAIYLESNYGIPAEKWQKVRGEGIIIENGKKRTVEIHWYEADGEKIKMKVKRYLDES